MSFKLVIPMTENTNNQNRIEAIKAEIGARVAAGKPFGDLLAMLSAAPVEKRAVIVI